MNSDTLIALFNRGIVSKRVMGRVDVNRISLSAEEQTNWMPRTLGPMTLRPGWGYKGDVPDDGAYLPFIFTRQDNAILELTPSKLRVWDTGDTLVTRPAVTTAVDNGDFLVDLADWTDADEGSVASSVWDNGQMSLTGTGTEAAIRRQQLTVDAGEVNATHALRIVVNRGPVLLRIGTVQGGDDIFRQAVLRTGTHSIAFTPGITNPWIEFATTIRYPCLIESCNIEAAGTLELPTIWSTVDECRAARWDQTGDVVYVASGLRNQRIERRPNNSWSVVDFISNDGPFETSNAENIALTPTALNGEIIVTASQPIFEPGHVNAIWQITSSGQRVEQNLSADNTFTEPVFVTGTDGARVVDIVRSGTWSGTLTLQRSVGDIGNWVDVKTYTTNGTDAYNDGFDNSDIYYRVGFKTGDYTSGTAEIVLDYPNGSIDGVVRITAVASAQQVDAVVLTSLGGTDPTTLWREGAWSDVQDYPTAAAFYQGRLWWGGSGRLYGSISDDFTSYNPETEGDAGPINRTAGDGPVQQINWMLPMERLMVGTDTRELSIRSNSFDEPVTPSNFNSKQTSTKGSAGVPASVSNSIGFFVGKNTSDVYELRWVGEEYAYRPNKTTLLVPEIGQAGIVRMAHQEEPDVRLHCIRADGTAAVLVRDAAENVLAWVEVETDGFIEDVVVLPGTIEDRVFYRVRRVINGTTVRYHEEWAREDQCRGGTANLQADSFVQFINFPAVPTITGLDHLEAAEVVVWADGKDLGTFTVSLGQITLPESVTQGVVGLGYRARYKSAKLAVQTQLGWDLMHRKKISNLGMLLTDTHYQGLRYGSDFDNMDELPLLEKSKETPADTVWEAYDEDTFEFNGEWSTDSRLCLEANAPRPCTVLAALFNVHRQNS